MSTGPLQPERSGPDPPTPPSTVQQVAGASFSQNQLLAVADGPPIVDSGASAAWEGVYRVAYLDAYAALADRINDAAASAANGLTDHADPQGRARAALRSLGDAARRAHDLVRAPAASDGSAGETADHDATPDRSGTLTPADREKARRRGVMDGALEGAHAIVVGWRANTHHRNREGTLGGGTVTGWLHSTLAATSWQVVQSRLDREGHGHAATAALNFAQSPGSAATAAPMAAHSGLPFEVRRRGPRQGRT